MKIWTIKLVVAGEDDSSWGELTDRLNRGLEELVDSVYSTDFRLLREEVIGYPDMPSDVDEDKVIDAWFDKAHDEVQERLEVRDDKTHDDRTRS